MKPNQEIAARVRSAKANSAWARGVKAYALELLESATENGHPLDMQGLLNGAKNWSEYSYGGCALIYDADIAERLCSPSELRKTRNGERQPNSRETWLDVQARALSQAARIVTKASV